MSVSTTTHATSGTHNSPAMSEMVSKLIGSGASVSTILLATQIFEADQRTTNVVKTIEAQRDYRGAMQERISELRTIATFIKKHNKDDKEMNGIAFVKHFDEFIAEHGEIAEKYGLEGGVSHLIKTIEVDVTPVAGAYRTETQTDYREAIAEIEQRLLGRQTFSLKEGRVDTEYAAAPYQLTSGKVSADDLEMQAEKLEGKVKQTDSESQLLTIKLQEVTQQKQRYVTLQTNLMQAEHRAKKAPLDNMRV